MLDPALYAALLFSSISVGVALGLAIWAGLSWDFGLNRRSTFASDLSGNLSGQYCRYVVRCSVGIFANLSVSLALPLVFPNARSYVLVLCLDRNCRGNSYQLSHGTPMGLPKKEVYRLLVATLACRLFESDLGRHNSAPAE